jgi:hypothetical protein
MNAAASRRESDRRPSIHPQQGASGRCDSPADDFAAEQALLAFFLPDQASERTSSVPPETQTELDRQTRQELETVSRPSKPSVAQACHVEAVLSQTDKELEERLQNEFERSGISGFQSLQVSVQHGIVHLSGELDSHYELVIALQLASRTCGVLGVRHSIQVEAIVEEKLRWTDMGRAFASQYRRELKRTVKFTAAAVVLLSGWAVGHRLFASNTKPVELVPAHGVVTFDGGPAAGAVVRFHSPNINEKDAWHPQAMTDEDGKFTLSTFERNDGAPEGRFVVTVTWHKDVIGKSGRTERGPNVIPTKFSQPSTSPLKVTVSRKDAALAPIVIAK